MTDSGSDNSVRTWSIGTQENPISGGLNIADLEFMLADNQSPRMKNMWFDGRVLSKRPGQQLAGTLPQGERETPEKIGAIAEFGGALVVVAGSKLYRAPAAEKQDEAVETAVSGGDNATAFGGKDAADTPNESGVSSSAGEEETCAAGQDLAGTSAVQAAADETARRAAEPAKWSAAEPVETPLMAGRSTLAVEEVPLSETGERDAAAGGLQFTELFEGVEDPDGIFFRFGGKLYYLSKKDYIAYDGETAALVEPYAPNVVINRPPNGEGGDLTENYNRLGGRFRNTFHGDGTSTDYLLTDEELDEGVIQIVVDGETLDKETYTVDYAAGTVHFQTAPSKGTNNVEITVSKLDKEMRDELMACRVVTSFGGTNGTRVFFAGNGSSTFYYSEVLDPTYFPDNNYNVVGDNGGDITGMACQYGVLILFLEREIWQASYSFDGERVSFPLKVVNRGIGCDAPGSIQLVNNNLVFLNRTVGVCILLSTEIADERNVQVISRNIARGKMAQGLLDEHGLENAVSLDRDGKYWLIVDGHAWLWDYAVSPYVLTGNPDVSAKALSWFYFDGIEGHSFAEAGDKLYFACDRGVGIMRKESFHDFGEPYEALWRIPVRNFNTAEARKTVLDLYVTVRTDTNARAEMRYFTEQRMSGEPEWESLTASSFSYAGFSWDTFTFAVTNFFRTFRRKPRKRQTMYFAVEFRNSETGRDMNISGLTLTYRITGKVRR